MQDARYFELADHVGLYDDGQPQPLHEFALPFMVATMVPGGRIAHKPKRVVLRPFAPKKHPRTIRVTDAVVAHLVAQHPCWVEVDPPKTEQTLTNRQANQAAAASKES